MYAFLLILGAIMAAAGMVLVVPGLPIGHDFDASVITPGAVAIVGGLILVGLGLAVRVLTRIEKALAVRPVLRPVLKTETVVGAAVAEEATQEVTQEPSAPPLVRMPLPPKVAAESRPQPVPAVVAAPAVPSLPEDAALERFREKFPTLVRPENTPAVDEAEVSLLPAPPVHIEEDAAEANGYGAATAKANGAASAKANGGAPARLELASRAAGRPAARPRNFDAFWPKKARGGGGAQPAPVPPAAPTPVVPAPAVAAVPVEPVFTAEPLQFQFREPAAVPHVVAAPAVPEPAYEQPMPISILKSGVVDGMAYTLYSDGSIEAQLPQGTLRFGSIAELRNHIEQSA
jgi:hypothetical protein